MSDIPQHKIQFINNRINKLNRRYDDVNIDPLPTNPSQDDIERVDSEVRNVGAAYSSGGGGARNIANNIRDLLGTKDYGGNASYRRGRK